MSNDIAAAWLLSSAILAAFVCIFGGAYRLGALMVRVGILCAVLWPILVGGALIILPFVALYHGAAWIAYANERPKP